MNTTKIPQVFFGGCFCTLEYSRYANGRTAIRLWCDDGPMATATVNVPDYNGLREDEVIIKDYSENEGILDALVSVGIVEDTGRVVDMGYVLGRVCKLLVKP
jgi:hypothetical protein